MTRAHRRDARQLVRFHNFEENESLTHSRRAETLQYFLCVLTMCAPHTSLSIEVRCQSIQDLERTCIDRGRRSRRTRARALSCDLRIGSAASMDRLRAATEGDVAAIATLEAVAVPPHRRLGADVIRSCQQIFPDGALVLTSCDDETPYVEHSCPSSSAVLRIGRVITSSARWPAPRRRKAARDCGHVV